MSPRPAVSSTYMYVEQGNLKCLALRVSSCGCKIHGDILCRDGIYELDGASTSELCSSSEYNKTMWRQIAGTEFFPLLLLLLI